MREQLEEFLRSFEGVEPEWGVNDCSTAPGLWVARYRGIAIEWPYYDSKESAYAIIDAAGGLVEVWEGILAPLGIGHTSDPQCGDVGVVRMGTFPTGGVIFGTGGVAFIRATGRAGWLHFRPRPKSILRAWSIA